ncbi:hypothetical protein [Clostridium sp.]|uniref:hypothetical protein n=1 Tax=Clostridium sp. TaxID=1506 RepID=UPI001A3B8FFB|nr:hypothetical protein [Clostridium sp.]MBK5241694.1 hypothetical protein [Clostridium sp.]
MGRDKSVDNKKTSLAINYYYNEAKRKGLLDKVLNEGQFKEDAIRTAIARGRISIKMIGAFCVAMGIDSKELTGESELTGNVQNISQLTDTVIKLYDEVNYDEILRDVQLIIETQKVNPNEQREKIIKMFDDAIKNNNW